MRYQHRLKVLQEGESWLRQELACIGLELRKEQLQELYHTQQLHCDGMNGWKQKKTACLIFLRRF